MEGKNILKDIFKNGIPGDATKHIVPLSGGLDSRAILAHLIEAGLREKIIAVTYGVPGTYDFEIGKIVADFAGVEHRAFNLDQLDIERKKLIFTCETGGAWTNLTHTYYSRIAVERYGNNPYYWSGFLGGELAGSHYHQGYEHLGWNESKSIFWEFNRREKNRRVDLTDKLFDYNSVLPDQPLIEDASIISYPEQLDLCIRQNGWIKKQVVDFAPKVITPFSHPAWIRFMLATPFDLRINCELYRLILKSSFPDYYSLPTKNLKGGSLFDENLSVFRMPGISYFKKIKNLLKKSNKMINKNLNYIDDSNAYRKRDDYISLAIESISSLNEMSLIPWLNPIDLWNKHYRCIFNIPNAIACLISLEISLSVISNE